MNSFVRLLINSIAVAAAAALIPGIEVVGGSAWLAVILTALVLGVLNTWLKPFLEFLSCGAVILTLGLFSLVINAVVLLIAAWLTGDVLGMGFTIAGFWPAFWGGIVIAIVSWALDLFIVNE